MKDSKYGKIVSDRSHGMDGVGDVLGQFAAGIH